MDYDLIVLGPAYRNIPLNKPIYPMISSTAARSGMTLTYSRSFQHSLQLQCLLAIGRATFWPENISIFKCHDLPPGLRGWAENNYWWVTCKSIVTKEVTVPSKGVSSGKSTSKKSQGLRRKKAGDNEEKDLASNADNKRQRLRSLGGSVD